MKKGEIEKSASFYRKAVEVAKIIDKLPDSAAPNVTNKSNILHKEQKALWLTESITSVGDTYVLVHNYNAALHYYSEALETVEKNTDMLNYGPVRINALYGKGIKKRGKVSNIKECVCLR